MKTKKNISYFPVSDAEQALLLRVRESDLEGRLDEVLDLLDQIAAAKLTPEELKQAVRLFAQSRRGDVLDMRFASLEAALTARIERGLTEIEERLSRRVDEHPPRSEPQPSEPPKGSPTSAAGGAEEAKSGEKFILREASVAFRVGDELIWGRSAAQFYTAIWRWLFGNNYCSASDLPIQSGRSRYAISANPVHPNGRDFFAAHEMSPGTGIWVETHMSKDNIIQRSQKLLEQYGIEYEIVLGDD